MELGRLACSFTKTQASTSAAFLFALARRTAFFGEASDVRQMKTLHLRRCHPLEVTEAPDSRFV